MDKLREFCPACRGKLLISFFDANFRKKDVNDQLIFDMPASFCKHCDQLYLEENLVRILGLEGYICVFAIQRDKQFYPDWKDFLK